MNVCELRVQGICSARRLAALRWELFVFPEVRDVFRTVREDTVAVLYEGDQPDHEAWYRRLRETGFDVDPPEGTRPESEPREAA